MFTKYAKNGSHFDVYIRVKSTPSFPTILQLLDAEHARHSARKRQHLEHIHDELLLEQVPPYIGRNVHEIPGHKHHNVALSLLRHPHRRQPHDHSDQRHKVDDAVREDGLAACEPILEEDRDVTEFPGDLVGEDRDDHGGDHVLLAGREHQADAQAVHEVVDERA